MSEQRPGTSLDIHTIYVNNSSFELVPGERIEATVVWPWWFMPLTPIGLTLQIRVVGDRVIRLDSGRRLRRRHSKWRVFKLAPDTKGV